MEAEEVSLESTRVICSATRHLLCMPWRGIGEQVATGGYS